MEFSELLEKRRSVREYAETPVEKEKIEKIVNAAFAAPSAGNLQSYKIIIVRDKKAKEALSEAANSQKSILLAPVVLAFFADQSHSSKRYGVRGINLYAIQDATIAAAYAQLAAADLGLSSVWVGAFEPDKVSKILGAEQGEYPVALLPVGHAAPNVLRAVLQNKAFRHERKPTREI